MSGENCRSGCKERNHATYGQCLRSAGIRTTTTRVQTNAWDQELDLYRDARKQGIQPASTRTPDIQAAIEFSDRHSVAFNAEDTVGSMTAAGLVDA